jgi:AraC-like DNA-binding protein
MVRAAPKWDRVTSLPTATGGLARAAYARALNAKLDVSGVLKSAGLSRSQISKPEIRIAARSQIKFLDQVAAGLKDDLLGLHLAQSIDLRELGLLYYTLASSEDFQSALTRLARYSGIHNESVGIRVHAGKHISVLFEYIGVPRTSDRHQIEFFIATLVRLCRHITGRQLSPVEIRLIHRRPEVPRDLTAFFGCPVAFGTSRDEVVFQPGLKDVALTNADPYLNNLLQHYCEAALADRRGRAGDWRSKVENAIVPLLPHGEATIEKVAGRLGVTARTLARRLAREDVGFHDVLQDLRLRLAKEYFHEPNMSISQAAWLLGYAGPSAFSHAFKRWTGQSPRQLRPAAAHPLS